MKYQELITKVSKASPVEAISILLESGYEAYLREKHFARISLIYLRGTS